MTKVAIVDSGGANIASLLYALERLDVSATLTAAPEVIRKADRVILPGVGAAADAMQRLREHGLVETLRSLQQPVLGICLGLQLLADFSEEDDTPCLEIAGGTARRLTPGPGTPVPNMGWCPVNASVDHPLLDGISDGSFFYFLHSYALPVYEYTIATAEHNAPFTAVLHRDNFYATQFHPERSSAAGARLLENFTGNEL